MSELAFNLNGEPFELPVAAVGWRVRRIKGRGAPEVVYSRDGVPLILPIDADIDDLRHSARSEGRFRLDPVDEHNRVIPQAPAGYVCVQPPESSSELPPLTSRPPTDNVAIEAMRMNTELARTIIDRFPMMMDAAAGLLRAADGAGLPAREPRALVEDHVDDDPEEEGEEQAEQVAPKATGIAGFLETLVPLVMPTIMSAIASGGLKLPDGLGALLGCRRASDKVRSQAAAPEVHATTPGAGPAPGPRDPAPAGGGATRSGNRDPVRRSSGFAAARAAGSRERVSTTVRPGPSGIGPRDVADATSDVAAPQAHAVDSREVPRARAATTPLPDLPPDLPTIDQADMGHFMDILQALSVREAMYAQALAGELSPGELRAWIAELKELSVPEAVARIRAVLATESDTPNAPAAADALEETTGGVP